MSRGRTIVAGAVVLAVLGAWGVAHAVSIQASLDGHGHRFAVLFAITFALLIWQQVLASLERPFVTTATQDAALNLMRVAVNIPTYNEDHVSLRHTLESLLAQTRLPDVIQLVNDGSTDESATVHYPALRQWAESECARRGVEFTWVDKENGGKRSAQAFTFVTVNDADIFVTVDSDAIVDHRAIQELIKPFADERVMSVAGVVMATNNRSNLLCRMTDLLYVGMQLTGRSSMSTMRSVLVNSGALAAYRGSVIRKHMNGYLRETFLGRRVEFSDDSMLTLYAAVEGHTVQQPTAVVVCLMPARVSHHLRQYLRWVRGSTIRSLWRTKYLPKSRYGWWANLVTWLQVLMSWIVFTVLVVTQSLRGDWSLVPWFIGITVILGYLQSIRYLIVRRSDESAWSRVLTWLLSPLATLWALFILRPTRIYGMATCWKTGWGTRSTVEVRMPAALHPETIEGI